jgi:hypothetical protein
MEDASSYSFDHLLSVGRTSSLSFEKANSLEAQFQPVNDPSELAVIEMVNEAMSAYESELAKKSKLTRLS